VKRIDVVNQVVGCTRCELHEQCTLPVALRGEPGPVAVVGEAPGEQEDIAGQPFVGPAGKLLADLLGEAGITEPLAFINTVSCWPRGTPTWDHVRSCEANKWAQLDYVNPTYVLLLGKVALKGMRPELDLKRGRARPFVVRDRICFATYHPAAALRNHNYEDTLRDELALFRLLLDAEDWQDLIPETCSACAVEADWWEDGGLGWCRVHLPEQLAAAYDARQAVVAAELDAARRRDAALVQVALGAGPDWMAAAWDALVDYLRTHPSFFVDDFWADTSLERPRESRALGPVVLRAAREGLMAKSGQFRKSTASNMTEKPIWTSKIHKVESPSGR
jgi:DNA polymerase